MNIELNKRYYFSDITTGDTFIYKGKVYMKMFAMGNTSGHNSIELASGKAIIFDTDTLIEPITLRVVEAKRK